MLRFGVEREVGLRWRVVVVIASVGGRKKVCYSLCGDGGDRM